MRCSDGQIRRLLAGIGLVCSAAMGACEVNTGDCPSTVPPEIGTAGPAGYALRFCGTGDADVDRVKVIVDDPRTGRPGPPVDVGASDFTVEWWMKAWLSENPSKSVECGPNINWIHGNIIFDRDRYAQGRKFGISVAGGRIVFGVSGGGESHRTVCGMTNVANGEWHHVAVQRRRSDGRIELFVDGHLEAEAVGPTGDVSYPDDGVPGVFCDGICFNSDPFLVIGAEKHDAGPQYPSYSGWLDEVRLSRSLRYAGDFAPSAVRFEPDSSTVALWHFDEGEGYVLRDSSPHEAHGLIHFGGPRGAPRWDVSDAPIR